MAYNLFEESKIVHIEIRSPLKECLRYCEIHCVAGCCGVDAFSTEEKDISLWAQIVAALQVHIALAQIQALIEIAEDRNYKISSTYINAHTSTDAARNELLVFLKEFERSLNKVSQENPL